MSSEKTVGLGTDQQRAYDVFVKQRKSMFLTGSAGTGKSLLIQRIIGDMRKALSMTAVAVTASTGVASAHIGGSTRHSFAGIGLGDEDVNVLKFKIAGNVYGERWRRTKVLIIDEISMISAELFTKLVLIARHVRGINKGFGGIQVLISGDFLQLPPVKPRYHVGRVLRAYESPLWRECVEESVCLRQVFRQESMDFYRNLLALRAGFPSADLRKFLTSLDREIPNMWEGEPVNLYSDRRSVQDYNLNKLDALSGEMMEYKTQDKYTTREDLSLLKNVPAPDVLKLKKGAQVMLVKNMDKWMVNGLTGIVTGFKKETPDSTNGKGDPWFLPKVRFSLNNGDVVTKIIRPEEWEVKSFDGRVVACRRQIPLILAWAVTIHKSQGQTIPRLRVDMSKVFETGQAYVAISRATDSESLQVVGYRDEAIIADITSLKYYKDEGLL
jgi:ATP-dependent DNA helicase PIF1